MKTGNNKRTAIKITSNIPLKAASVKKKPSLTKPLQDKTAVYSEKASAAWMESAPKTSTDPVKSGTNPENGPFQNSDSILSKALSSKAPESPEQRQGSSKKDVKPVQQLLNYVYIVECSDSSYYTGYTNNLEHRIRMHNQKKGARYTKGRTPVKLVYFEEYKDRHQALSREWHLKKLTRSQKKALVDSFDQSRLNSFKNN